MRILLSSIMTHVLNVSLLVLQSESSRIEKVNQKNHISRAKIEVKCTHPLNLFISYYGNRACFVFKTYPKFADFTGKNAT